MHVMFNERDKQNLEKLKKLKMKKIEYEKNDI